MSTFTTPDLIIGDDLGLRGARNFKLRISNVTQGGEGSQGQPVFGLRRAEV